MEIIEIDSDEENNDYKRYNFICGTINRIIKDSFEQQTVSNNILSKPLLRTNFPDEISIRSPYIYLKSSYVRSLKTHDEISDEFELDLIVKMLLEATNIVIPQDKNEELKLYKIFWENNQLKMKDKFKKFSNWYNSMRKELMNWRTWILMDINCPKQNQCSNDCYKEKVNLRFNFIYTVSDEYRIRDAMMIYGRDFCKIAANLMKPMTCNQIFKIVRQGKIMNFCTDKNLLIDPRPQNQRIKFLKQRNGKEELLVTTISFYQPCIHYGQICDAMCPCYNGKNFCEIYCGCDSLCLNKFSGCACLSQCNTKLCSCFLAYRECDPELCKKHDDEKCACKNMMLQSGIHKDLIVKQSSIDGIGLGAFAAETIESKEFIIEYTGELITNTEADRRADFYHNIKSIYIFALCKQYSIDAYKIGNESRFINHSDTPNCRAKIINIKGDKRIAIYAKQKINVDEELFLSYKFNEKHKELYFKK
ncbi:hypothetical protein PVAND_012043 [Polypedilum vanderplanki]|uniref:[histone H3]-lysine(27) N-trimethyltransferase n=1 Tax=Polypedilum vanderplanki TaxID=319348 RepID=A0A9J6CL84_POLVA|nr:hypothetical protein PVAND_012043 [Polypedilum vanderplanki]